MGFSSRTRSRMWSVRWADTTQDGQKPSCPESPAIWVLEVDVGSLVRRILVWNVTHCKRLVRLYSLSDVSYSGSWSGSAGHRGEGPVINK